MQDADKSFKVLERWKVDNYSSINFVTYKIRYTVSGVDQIHVTELNRTGHSTYLLNVASLA